MYFAILKYIYICVLLFTPFTLTQKIVMVLLIGFCEYMQSYIEKESVIDG